MRAGNASRCAIDAKQRQLIWPDAERLDLVQSIQRIQKLYPDFPGHEIEEVLLNWIDMGYDPENYSRRNSTSLTASQSDGSPTISETQTPQKQERELVTLEYLTPRVQRAAIARIILMNRGIG